MFLVHSSLALYRERKGKGEGQKERGKEGEGKGARKREEKRERERGGAKKGREGGRMRESEGDYTQR